MPSHFRTSRSLRSRRQTNVDDIYSECRIILTRAECSSYTAQNYINAISKCGRKATTSITDTELACRNDHNGEYCGEYLNTGYVTGNCSGSSCSPGCFNILREADCCLNGQSGVYTRYFTACRIPLPSPCAKSRLRIPTITQTNSCISTQDFKRIEFAAECDNIRPIIYALERDDACKNFSDGYKDACASRNGQYCWLELNLTGDSVGLRSLQAAANECPSTSTCSLQCKSSLSFLKKTVGCCIQSVNNSFIYTPEFNTAILDSRLWNKCGVPLPSKCSATPIYVIYIFIVFLMAGIAFLKTTYSC